MYTLMSLSKLYRASVEVQGWLLSQVLLYLEIKYRYGALKRR